MLKKRLITLDRAKLGPEAPNTIKHRLRLDALLRLLDSVAALLDKVLQDSVAVAQNVLDALFLFPRLLGFESPLQADFHHLGVVFDISQSRLYPKRINPTHQQVESISQVSPVNDSAKLLHLSIYGLVRRCFRQEGHSDAVLLDELCFHKVETALPEDHVWVGVFVGLNNPQKVVDHLHHDVAVSPIHDVAPQGHLLQCGGVFLILKLPKKLVEVPL